MSAIAGWGNTAGGTSLPRRHRRCPGGASRSRGGQGAPLGRSCKPAENPPSIAAPWRTAGRRSCRPDTDLSNLKGGLLMTADVSPAPLTARNATLQDLAALLRDQQARKIDVVAPAPAILTQRAPAGASTDGHNLSEHGSPPQSRALVACGREGDGSPCAHAAHQLPNARHDANRLRPPVGGVRRYRAASRFQRLHHQRR